MLLLLVCAASARAADDTPWRLFTSDDGLPETWTEFLARDSRGGIWTSHGIPQVAHYDGYTTTTHAAPLPDMRLSVGPDDRLWALPCDETSCSGLLRLAGNRWETFRVDGLDGATRWNTRLLAWGANRALLLTPDRVFEVDAESGHAELIRRADGSGIGRFAALQRARDGGAWIGGELGVAHLSRSGEWTVTPSSARVRGVARIYDAPRGLIVVARDGNGSAAFVREGHAWTRVAMGTPDAPIVAAWESIDEIIWIARGSGREYSLSLIRPGEPERRLPRMRAFSGRLNDISPAQDGGFWLATSVGLARYLPLTWRRPHAPASDETPTGSLLQTRAGSLLALQDDRLLQRTGMTWRAHPLPPRAVANIAFCDQLAELPDGRIAVGQSNRQSPLLFDPSRGVFTRLQHPEGRSVDLLGRTHAGDGFWAITRGGSRRSRIERYDGSRFTVRAELEGDWDGMGRPRVILETSTGDLIVTPTSQGVGRLRGDTWTYYPGPMPVTGSLPFAAVELRDGRVWFGGREGVSELRDDGLQLLRGGLQTVRSLVAARDGSVWAASNSGVHRFFEGTWLSMTDDDGLPEAAAYDVLQDSYGAIWVATAAGISMRDEHADRDPPHTVLPPELNSIEAPASGELQVLFGGVDRYRHTPTSRLVYSHRLDDGPWSPFAPGTSVALSNMKAGTHTFAVRAMDRGGRVDDSPAVWRLTVVLPWYREPWVLLLIVVTCAGAVIALAMFFTRHRRLERLVRARTQELQNELAERQRIERERADLEQQLHQSQRMEALGRLAGGISHDFNNLLTVICSYGDLLAEEIPSGDPRHPHAEEIVKAANRAAVLTQQLLSFSRHQAVARQVLDLNTTLADLLRMLSRLLGEDVEVRFVPGTNLWPIRAHRGQLEQVVVNLAVNARDAMPDGGKLVIETANLELSGDYVRMHVAASAGPHVRLSVIDTGTGMDPDTASRIFEPFFTTKERGKGSGLGLSMVYGIVQQHDGHIVVHSTPGEGTRFDIYVPRTFDRPPAPAEPAQRAHANGRETILLVEDEDAVRQLASEVLSRSGYHVVTANSGEDALALVDAQAVHPDLLLTDVVMPGISGKQLAEQLRARWSSLPVILMSGYATDVALDDRAPRVSFLQKPFTASTLGQAVGEMLKH